MSILKEIQQTFEFENFSHEDFLKWEKEKATEMHVALNLAENSSRDIKTMIVSSWEAYSSAATMLHTLSNLLPKYLPNQDEIITSARKTVTKIKNSFETCMEILMATDGASAEPSNQKKNVRFSYSEYIPSENDNDDATFEKEGEVEKNEELKNKDKVAEPNADDDSEFEDIPAGDSEDEDPIPDPEEKKPADTLIVPRYTRMDRASRKTQLALRKNIRTTRQEIADFKIPGYNCDVRIMMELTFYDTMKPSDETLKQFGVPMMDDFQDKIGQIKLVLKSFWKSGLEDIKATFSKLKPATGKYFGSFIKNICEREESSVPKLISGTISKIEADKMFKTIEGLYRVNGNMEMIATLKSDFNNDRDANFKNVTNLHTLAGLIKLFLRELKEPLIPWEVMSTLMTLKKQEKLTLEAANSVIKAMNPYHRDTLVMFMQHLNKVLKSSDPEKGVTADKLAITVGPSMSWCTDTQESAMVSNMKEQIKSLGFLIENAEKLEKN